jgi:hypothetical protein
LSNMKNVQLCLFNGTDHEIKVTKIEYHDEDKWKTEAWLGLDGHQKLMPKKSVEFKRQDLEGVGGELTMLTALMHEAAGEGWRM